MHPENACAYGTPVGRLTLNHELKASGKVCLRTGAADSAILVGWYNSRTPIAAPPANFLGVLVERPSRIGHYVRPVCGTSDDIKGGVNEGPLIRPDSRLHTWALHYDPGARDGNGCITVTLDDEAVLLDVPAEARKGNAAFDRVTLFACVIQHLHANESLFAVFNKVVGSLAGLIIPIFVLGMFSRRVGSLGVCLGAVLGFAATYYWAFHTSLGYGWTACVAFVVIIVVAYAVSLFEQPPPPGEAAVVVEEHFGKAGPELAGRRRKSTMRCRLSSVMACALFATILAGAPTAVAEPYGLGGDTFLFLDEFLLNSMVNAELTVNPPRFDALVLIADKPWEKGGITSYGNVFHDPMAKEYRLYYVPVSWDVEPGFCLCLATSQDGVNWEKPNLGAVEWRGSTDNNIVLWAQREGTVILDPNAAPEHRYALISSHPELKTRLFTSPDGIHFTMHEAPVSDIHSDSQISSFWDKDAKVYFHYPRVGHNGRATGVVVTKTMAAPWPEGIPAVLSRDPRDPRGMDLYTNACQKYEPVRHAYVGFPTPYYHWNEPPERAYLNAPTLAIGGKNNDGTIDSQLATSRDGKTWTRHRPPYIPMGNYDGLEVKVAMMIPGILYEGDRLYQYFMGYTFTHGDTQVRYGEGGRGLGGVFRVEQRVDGFISLDFDYEGGTVVTEPFVFDGGRLSVNINTSASGEGRIAILDADGKELDGYGLADARFINGNYTDKTVEWRDGTTDVSALAGKPVRLRFECRGTKLYSFTFKGAEPQ
jgi:hypothetical protein